MWKDIGLSFSDDVRKKSRALCDEHVDVCSSFRANMDSDELSGIFLRWIFEDRKLYNSDALFWALTQFGRLGDTHFHSIWAVRRGAEQNYDVDKEATTRTCMLMMIAREIQIGRLHKPHTLGSLP